MVFAPALVGVSLWSRTNLPWGPVPWKWGVAGASLNVWPLETPIFSGVLSYHPLGPVLPLSSLPPPSHSMFVSNNIEKKKKEKKNIEPQRI